MIKLTRIGNLYGDDRGTGFAGNVWDAEGLAPAITTMGGGNRQPIIIELVRYEKSKTDNSREL